ncbi:MAG: preprotein translocase subunit SecF, partial [Flavobacteriales bacterium]
MLDKDKVINFMGLKKIAMVLSIILVVASIFSLATKQLSFGLDFTGGTQIEVLYKDAIPLTEIRSTLEDRGFKNAVVVHFGSERDILVRLADGIETSLGVKKDQVGETLLATLREASNGNIELKRVEFVGPQVGEELREQGGLALLMALGVVMLYVAMRFQFKFSVGAVTALAH